VTPEPVIGESGTGAPVTGAPAAGDVVLVEACLRDGAGGSPTAVLLDGTGRTDPELAAIPPRAGTSHVAVLAGAQPPQSPHPLRFFTSEGELPSCGHGTVAAIAVLALSSPGHRFEGELHSGGRDFEASGGVDPAAGPDRLVEAWFDQGVVRLRDVTAAEQAAFLAALGLPAADLSPDGQVVVASPGRERLLIPVADRAVLARLRPDPRRLLAASRDFGQLGCFVYVPPTPAGRAAARMFAPAIGVPEDVANANSTGCLAAHLLATGRDPAVEVDQGDALGRPSSVRASATGSGAGITTRVGGTARLRT
jgi:trans-2,3-dihydro-3-hydroxyanthranilate isomerase